MISALLFLKIKIVCFFSYFLLSFNIVSFLCAQNQTTRLCASAFLRLYFRKLHSSLIIFLSISMLVILPISLLLSTVVTPMVSRSVPSSRCLLSHYVPALLLSFVETPACICRHTFIHATLIFLVLSPYRLSPSSCEYDIS